MNTELEETSKKDKSNILKVLKTIVPTTYQNGVFAKFYTDWRVITATPFPLTAGNEKNEGYYGMAKNFCGKEVADRSWLVRLYFPKWKGKSASSLEGQIFWLKVKKKDGLFGLGIIKIELPILYEQCVSVSYCTTLTTLL